MTAGTSRYPLAMRRCPACGSENAPEARYCSRCGTHLGLDQPQGATRKTVTILFSDIVGFTNLTEASDPERLRSVMARYAEEMRRVIERHDGTVEKFIGDAVMAVFGVPRLHEDDALRAVRAAVDMRDALRQLNATLAQERGVNIEVRTGVNTGEVVVSGAGPAGAWVVGDPVNVAARLQQAANPGEILIGPDTYQLVRGAVTVDALESVTLKGKQEPVSPFRLLAVLPGVPSVRPRHLDFPIVGRERELALLGRVFREVVAANACRTIPICGPPGIGKSRLVAEFVARLPDEATVLQAHCLPYGESITFWPVAQIVKQGALIGEEDSNDEARAKIQATLEEEEFDAPFVADRLLHVLGFPAVPASQEEVFWVVRKWLESLASRGPLVVIFEDVHWGDAAFLALIDHIDTWSRDSSILIVSLARPELLDKHPAWREKASGMTLGPLSEEDSAQLVENLLRTGRLAEKARARLAASAAGNPLYLEEMVTMLVERGLLHQDESQWRLTTDLDSVGVPITLHALLAARLETFSPEHRRAVEAASVIGNSFSPEALSNLLRGGNHEALEVTLSTLVEAEILTRESPGTLDALRFHHGLYREVAYNGLSKQVRADLHEWHAGWLERTAGGRVGEFEEIIGYHLETAYRYLTELGQPDSRTSMLASRAAERLTPAGCRAFARGDMVATANLLSRAVALYPPGHRRALAVLPDLAEACLNIGDLEQAGAVLGAAAASGDRRLQAHATLGLATLTFFTDPEAGGAERLRQEAASTLAIFEERGDHLGLARAWRLLSIVHLSSARFAEAEEAMWRAADQASQAGERRDELEALSWLPLMVWAGPSPPDRGMRRCDDILRSADGDHKVEATVLFVKAGFEAMHGQFDQARRLLDDARSLLEDLGLRMWMAGAFAQMSGWVEQLAGDAASAERCFRSGYRELEQLGEAGWLPTVAAHLAHALYQLREHDKAEQFTRISEERSNPDDVYSQVLWRVVRAKVLSAKGEHGEAERLAREAVGRTDGTDFLQLRGDAAAALAVVMEAVDPGEAAAMAAEAVRLFEVKGNRVAAEQTRRRLAGRAVT